MKHLTLILSTIFAVTAPAVAADKLSVPWGKLWGHVTNRQLTVTTTDQPVGYHGHFLRFESDTLVLEQAGSPGQLLKIARQKITKIMWTARTDETWPAWSRGPNQICTGF